MAGKKRGRPRKMKPPGPPARGRGRPPERLNTGWDHVGMYLQLRLDHPGVPMMELCRRVAEQQGYAEHQLKSRAEYIRQQLVLYGKRSATGSLKELEADLAKRRK